jgi:predicted NAD-dependent protein-ADP-ribosyltransferase YbiA (DUF1768 family)
MGFSLTSTVSFNLWIYNKYLHFRRTKDNVGCFNGWTPEIFTTSGQFVS